MGTLRSKENFARADHVVVERAGKLPEPPGDRRAIRTTAAHGPSAAKRESRS